MTNELPYRADLQPLCPVHSCPMTSDHREYPTFTCSAPNCDVKWQRHEGYYSPDPANPGTRKVLIPFLKTAYIVEHGYFYLASVDSSKKKTWRCSVKDCQNTTVEN